ncbi:hypothetical protein FQN54_005535 [Arachnomyces sp. PD_36]|nr:hypothetical protein FQN54_005535 [Arachnomyces sp. PD_36]
MTITSNYNAAGNYWGSLVRPDKSPSPLLIQLCLGIAQLMSTLEPSNTEDLTPQKIATFYRAVGGNYDTLFLSMRHSALSLVYQSLGCFHTLQPTNNAFEPPSIPALLPHGFVRWQTIQLLLCPDEHVRFLQEAVKRFDVVNPAGGGTFPKVIPREAFPAAPDPEMVEWHETVSQRLEQDAQAKLNTAAVPPPTNRSEPFHHHSSSIDSSDNPPESPDYFSHPPPQSVKGRNARGSRNPQYEERQASSLPGSRRPSTVAEEPRRPTGRFDARESYSYDNTRLRPQPSIENPPRQRRSKSSTRSDRQAKRPGTAGRQSRSRLNTVEVSSDTESDEDSDSGWPRPQAQRASRREMEMDRERQSQRYGRGAGSPSPTRPRHPSRPHSHDATYSDVRRRQEQREQSFSPRHPEELDEDEDDVEEDDDLDDEPYTMPMKPTMSRNLHYPHIPPPRPAPVTATPPSSRSSRSASAASGSHSSGNNNHFQTSRAPNPFKIPFREYIFPEDIHADHDPDGGSGGSSGRTGSGSSKSKSKSSKSKQKPKPRATREREPEPPTTTTRYHVPKYTPPPPPPPPPPQQQPQPAPPPPSRHHSRKGRNQQHPPPPPPPLTTQSYPHQSRPHLPTRAESDQRGMNVGGINIRRVRAQSHTRPPPVMNTGGHDRERSRWSISGMGMGMGGGGMGDRVWD